MEPQVPSVEKVFGSDASLLRILIDLLPDGIFIKDAQSRIVLDNLAHAQLLGAKHPDEVAGKTDSDWFPEEVASQFHADEQAVIESGHLLDREEAVVDHRTGALCWLRTTKVPLRDKEGNIVGLVGINRDITEQKRAEEALRHRNDYLTALQETTLDVISQLDLDRSLENILKRAGQLMGTSTGFLDLLEPGDDHLTPKIALGVLAEESLKFPVRRGEGLGGKVWQSGQPMLIEDYDAWSGRIKTHQGNLIRSVIAVPLVSKSGVVGVLGLAHEKATSQTFGPEAIQQLSQFARFATIAIENARLYSTGQRELAERRQTEEALRESQSLYHSLVVHMPAGVFRKNHEGRYAFVNAQFCRLKGMRAEEIVGKAPQELAAYQSAKEAVGPAQMTPRQHTLVSEGIDHHELIMRTGKPIEVEEVYPQPDGTVEYFQVVKSPIFGADGTVVGTQGMQFDITERKRVEETLARERVLLRTLIDNLPDGVYAKDTAGRKTLANPADLKTLRCKTEAEAIGKTDFDLFPRDLAERFWADDQQVIQGRPVLDREEFFFDEDGRQHWLLTSKLPLRNQAGAVVGLVGIGRDITAIKESERKLEALHGELLSASRQAGMAEVATGVLHNVGNVLNSVNVSVSLFNQWLRESKVDGVSRLAKLFQEQGADLARFLTEDRRGRQVPAYLGELAHSLERERTEMREEMEGLARNIDHIKEIVAMQQNYAGVSGVVERMAIPDLVEDALRINAASYLRHGVTVVREFDPLPIVSLDKHKFVQILVNLLSNAKQACDAAHHETKQVTVRLKAQPEGRVKVQVADNGVGIAAENLTRIFSQGFTTRKDGHGFGLHSSALAARELGGSLTVHSGGVGQGATFTLELPVAPATDPDPLPR